MNRLLKRLAGPTAVAVACVTLCSIASNGTTAAGKSTNQPKDGTGTFQIGGIEYHGKSSVQTFVNGNHSIICEQDTPYKLIQITFYTKTEAEKGGTFKAAEYELDIPSGQANIGIDGLTYDPDGAYTINVSNRKITIGAVKLKPTGGGGNTVNIQRAEINF